MRVVLPGASLPASLEPSCIPKTGSATTASTATVAIANVRGRRSMVRAQRAKPRGRESGGCGLPSLTLRPNAPSSAGRGGGGRRLAELAPAPDRAEQRGEQGERADHGGEHGERRGDRRAVQERDA